MDKKLTKEEIQLLSAIVAGKATSADSVEMVCSEVLVNYRKAINIFDKPNSDKGLLDYYKNEASKL